ncbi:MAG: carboxypeptidase-like regulatory domain-containing protein [Ferruginibacter sp.]
MKKYLLLPAVLLCHAGIAQNNIKTETFRVLGSCEMCKDRIESTVHKLKVQFAEWIVETNMLTVSYDSSKLTREKIERKIASKGHDTHDFKANDFDYRNLPECCKYNRLSTHGPAGVNDEAEIASGTITGIVMEEDKKGGMMPIGNASITSLHNKTAVVSDSAGVFHFTTQIPTQLVISYVGFKPDTVEITSVSDIKVILKNSSTSNLSEVVVRSKVPSTYISSLSTLNSLVITSRELAKAACCNLSESFETSPSVDVNYSDGVTGLKQIQLLGLSGSYSMLTTENTPELRGLSGSYGLNFIPGPWLESIEVTKGIGSVLNGYESISGQINIEEKKPDRAERILLNGYANNMGRLESNINMAKNFNSKWSTALLTHASTVFTKNDDNRDGFLDMPLGRQYNIISRWKYADTKGWIFQLALKAVNDKKQAGETAFDENKDRLTTNHYGLGINAEQYIGTAKLGYVFPQQKYKSLGLIVSAGNFNNHSYYGTNAYKARQTSFYSNFIFQSVIGNSFHKYRTGLSFMNDRFAETIFTQHFKRTETVPGAFFEYTFSGLRKFTAIAGLRADAHNEYGLMTITRLHLKYDFTNKTNLRFTAGSGWRTANIFAENTGLLASSRTWHIAAQNNFGYGLGYEKGWNFGFNFVHNFRINNNNGSVSIDAYHTRFDRQNVIDMDLDPHQVFVYSLNGKSFSNSLQAEINYSPFEHFDMRLAYRWLNVKTNYARGLMQKPLVANQRAFVNLAYETHSGWKFDMTTQWIGKKRIPYTESNPADKKMPSFSPSYFQANSQVSKRLGEKWEIYLGAENITNYTQKNIILSANDPFSQFFDASMVWGPVNERIIYLGFRFKVR